MVMRKSIKPLLMNFDKFKDTRASEKLSVKKGTKKKAITKEPPVGTIEEPKAFSM